jgi:hypothetical protein
MKSFHQFFEDLGERRQQLAQRQRDKVVAFKDRAKANIQKQAATHAAIKKRYDAMQQERAERMANKSR